MDRELLIEIGVEEMPASWLPGLTAQLTDVTTAPEPASTRDEGGGKRKKRPNKTGTSG